MVAFTLYFNNLKKYIMQYMQNHTVQETIQMLRDHGFSNLDLAFIGFSDEELGLD